MMRTVHRSVSLTIASTLLTSCGSADDIHATIDDAVDDEPDLYDGSTEAAEPGEPGAGAGARHRNSPEDTQKSDEPPMFNPWMVLADHPGPKPFFETLNDESGRRYVIGEGGFVDSEEGAEQAFPSLMYMEPAPPIQFGEDSPSPSPASVPAPSKLSDALATAISLLTDDDLVSASIGILTDEPGLQYELERAMAYGSIKTREDHAAIRDMLLAESSSGSGRSNSR